MEKQRQLLSLLPFCVVFFHNYNHVLVSSFNIIPKITKLSSYHKSYENTHGMYYHGGSNFGNKKEEWSSYVMADKSSYLKRDESKKSNQEQNDKQRDEEQLSQRINQSMNELAMEPGRRFNSIKQMDALHEVGNEENLRRLWRSKRNNKVPQNEDYLENTSIDNVIYQQRRPNKRLIEDNNEPGRRFDCVQLSDNIHRVDNDNSVLRGLYSRTSSTSYNEGYSAAFFEEKNRFGRDSIRKERRVDDTRRGKNQMSEGKNKSIKKNGRNKLQNEQLSQRILRAMDPYDPYFEEQQEAQDRFDAIDRDGSYDRKGYKGSATDLETRLESFKDYESSRKKHDRMEPMDDYVFPSQFGPQNPYKRYDDFDDDRTGGDNMRDLEEDLLKSPNPYKQNRDTSQEVHDSTTNAPETKPDVEEDTSKAVDSSNLDVTTDPVSGTINEVMNENPAMTDSVETTEENDKMSRVEKRLDQMESRLMKLLDKLESKLD